MTAWFSTESRRATYQRGRRAEQAAIDYLRQQGLKLVCRNYRAPCGEIDIVMRDGTTLVFVEVRYRADEKFCRAIETIGNIKQSRLRATAEHYLQRQHLDDASHDSDSASDNCRFDVITISGPDKILVYNWLANAF